MKELIFSAGLFLKCRILTKMLSLSHFKQYLFYMNNNNTLYNIHLTFSAVKFTRFVFGDQTYKHHFNQIDLTF